MVDVAAYLLFEEVDLEHVLQLFIVGQLFVVEDGVDLFDATDVAAIAEITKLHYNFNNKIRLI